MFPNLHLYRDAPTQQGPDGNDDNSQGAHVTGAPSELRSILSDPHPDPPPALPTTPSFSSLFQQAAAALTRSRTPPPAPSPNSPGAPRPPGSPQPPLHHRPGPSPLHLHPATHPAALQPGMRVLSLSPLIRVADLHDNRLTHLQPAHPPLSPRAPPASRIPHAPAPTSTSTTTAAPSSAPAAAPSATAGERGLTRIPSLSRDGSGASDRSGGATPAAAATVSTTERLAANGTSGSRAAAGLARGGSAKRGGGSGAAPVPRTASNSRSNGGSSGAHVGGSGGVQAGGSSGAKAGSSRRGSGEREREGVKAEAQGEGNGGEGQEGAPHMAVLSELLEQAVLQPGQRVRFQPYDIAVRGYRPPAIEYQRPQLGMAWAERGKMRACLQYADEELAASLQDSTIGLLCRHVSLANIIGLLSAALLEQRLVLLCPHMGLLTACTLSLVPLLRPFRWQHPIMTVLPASLADFLAAPSPVILGVNLQQLADLPGSPYAQQMGAGELVEAQRHWVVLNVHANTLTCGPDALQLSKLSLPGTAQLTARLQRAYGVLHAAPAQQGAAGMRRTYSLSHPERLEAAREMAATVRAHLDDLMQGVYACSIKEAGAETRVVLKEQLAATFAAPREAAWMAEFIKTTLFDAQADHLLRNT